MAALARPRRSVLYMPGANTRALEKARSLPADALIFDLEDAVAPDAKEAARTHVVALLDTAGAPPTMTVWAMMETPKGILRAEEIAGSHPRLALFVMGTNDLVKDMRARHTPMRLPMMTAIGLGMLAARA